MLSRRGVFGLAAALAVRPPGDASAWAATTQAPPSLSDLEHRLGGQLGVAILDTGSGAMMTNRADERFPLCSTHKALSVACTLARVDSGQERLDRRVTYGRDVLMDYAPVTKLHVDDGMTVAELCAAAITVSDNTAANLILDACGGPQAVTAFLRGLGDTVTRLDRREPALNEVAPGDARDTTTPRAMATTLQTLALGTALTPASRDQLVVWMRGCQTGLHKIRAGVPPSWQVADKTGSGPRHAINDVAVLWPPGQSPLVVTAFTIDADIDDARRDAILADVGRLAATGMHA